VPPPRADRAAHRVAFLARREAKSEASPGRNWRPR
jgi:hypothetical protein